MKNLKYFPFARSRYFYGKLLTVDDFETEQKYMNDKRRMINRFLHGSGVVCGMHVVRVDDRTISVEMGLALDFAGREIVVDAPIIRKLDMIDGYDDTAGEDGYLYLCIEYAEQETEPVHSITGAGARGTGEVEYNKYAEGYRIFFTTQEPEHEGFTIANYYQDTKTVYWGNGIRIKQSLRRFLTAGGPAVLTVVVENMGQQQPVAFDYDLALTCLQHEGRDRLHVHFDEKEHPKAGRYRLEFPLTALDVRAVGLSGKDGSLLTAKAKDPALGLVGEIVRVDTDLLITLLTAGYLPVISPIAGGDGPGYNCNADDAARSIAEALGASVLTYLTDTDGVLVDSHNAATVIPHMTLDRGRELLDSGLIAGGMAPKVRNCLRAVERGVGRVVILNGTVEHALLLEAISQKSLGTTITKD